MDLWTQVTITKIEQKVTEEVKGQPDTVWTMKCKSKTGDNTEFVFKREGDKFQYEIGQTLMIRVQEESK